MVTYWEPMASMALTTSMPSCTCPSKDALDVYPNPKTHTPSSPLSPSPARTPRAARPARTS